MKTTFWTTTAALALAAVLSTAANSATLTVSLGSGTNLGAFDDAVVGLPSPGNYSGTTESLYGLLSYSTLAGGVFNGSAGFALAPEGDTTNYLFGEGQATVTFPKALTSFDFYWGSIDTWNSITLSNGATIDGTTSQMELGIAGKPNSSQSLWVKVTSDTPFTSFTVNSTQPAFEFDMATIPESSTWAMMMLGFAGLGYAAFRRTGKSSRPVIA